jgi:hypothetical protein
MLAFTVRNRKTGWEATFYNVSVGVRLLPPFRGRPQLEIWERGGGGLWSRCLIRFVHGEYRWVRADEFSEWTSADRPTKSWITATLPRSDDILYFMETRIPSGSGGELFQDEK